VTIRLLLADDQELVRQALCALLALEDDFEVVASVGRGDEVVAAAREHRPDVALLDIEMPGGGGLHAARAIKAAAPAIRVLALSAHDSDEARAAMADAGADGYVVKDKDGSEKSKYQSAASTASGISTQAIAGAKKLD